MKTVKLFSIALACVLFAGCQKSARSISHSDYQTSRAYCGPGDGRTVSDAAFEYRGELSEFDVLGIARDEIASEADIRRALENNQPLRMRPDSPVLLIQSGALFPDGDLVAELGKHFHVIPFSGVPPLRRTRAYSPQTESSDPEGYSKSLRLTAARGGAEFILCYWGVLESESDRLPTKTVSWLPLVNWLVPDETQHMHIRLKIALVDVRTGKWTVFSPKPLENTRISTAPRRAAIDQKQVERLKALAYQSSTTELVRAFE